MGLSIQGKRCCSRTQSVRYTVPVSLLRRKQASQARNVVVRARIDDFDDDDDSDDEDDFLDEWDDVEESVLDNQRVGKDEAEEQEQQQDTFVSSRAPPPAEMSPVDQTGMPTALIGAVVLLPVAAALAHRYLKGRKQASDSEDTDAREAGDVSTSSSEGKGNIFSRLFSKSESQEEDAEASRAGGSTPGASKKQLAAEAKVMLNQFVDQLRNEERVDLSGKNLMDEGVEFVAEGLAFNTTCKAASFGSNGIAARASMQLAECIKVNTSLQELHLDTNQIDDEAAAALAEALAVNASITMLNLTANRIGDAGMAALAEMLKSNATLEELDLTSNEIGYDGAVALAKALTENSTLTTLRMSDNYIGTLGASTLANALAQNTGVHTLALKGSELSDAGIERLCDALMGRETKMQVLDVGNNSITSAGAPHIAALLDTHPLTELLLNMNDLADAGMYDLAKVCKKRDTLHTLDIGGNNIGPEGMAVLMQSLKGRVKLRVLELMYNPLNVDGTKAVVEAVKYELPLKELRMGWCKVGERDGAVAVAELLQFNETLEVLDLRGNNLKDNGAMVIGRAMRQMQNSNLQRIDLGYNEIEDDGAFTIANAVKNNPDFMPPMLALNQNYFTNAGKVALQEAVEDVFEIYENEITVEYT